MHCTRRIKDDLIWVGVDSRKQSLFEAVYSIPDGVSYNSYLIIDEKTVLVDTVDRAVTDIFLENIEPLILICFCFLDVLPNPSGFPCGSAGKDSTCNVRDLGSILELGKSPREGKGYPLQYSGLENSLDCIVSGIAKSQTRLSDFH